MLASTGGAVVIALTHAKYAVCLQVHTTGQDVQQPFTGVAVVTLSKDMTLRDYKQGVWRMRLVGQG